jgi:hypothetical protein
MTGPRKPHPPTTPRGVILSEALFSGAESLP